MTNNFSYKDSILTVNQYNKQFSHLIRDVQMIDDKIIVLLAIPPNDNTINNLYALNNKCEILWQAQDLKAVFNEKMLLPYEQIVIDKQEIRASDFYGRRYYVNSENGKIIKRDITK